MSIIIFFIVVLVLVFWSWKCARKREEIYLNILAKEMKRLQVCPTCCNPNCKNIQEGGCREFISYEQATKENIWQTGNFSKDTEFQKACTDAGTPSTKRQAQKYLHQMGKAYKAKFEPTRIFKR